VLLWFVGFALVVTWVVFHDPAIDYRLLILGALLPDVIDAVSGGVWVFHALVAAVTTLMVVMLATRGHRHARRRWLALPIGMFLHLLADGVWTRAHTFWWPFLGRGLGGPLPSIDHGVAVAVLEELAGLAAMVWFVLCFRLTDEGVRATFVRTGRLPRDRVG